MSVQSPIMLYQVNNLNNLQLQMLSAQQSPVSPYLASNGQYLLQDLSSVDAGFLQELAAGQKDGYFRSSAYLKSSA